MVHRYRVSGKTEEINITYYRKIKQETAMQFPV